MRCKGQVDGWKMSREYMTGRKRQSQFWWTIVALLCMADYVSLLRNEWARSICLFICPFIFKTVGMIYGKRKIGRFSLRGGVGDNKLNRYDSTAPFLLLRSGKGAYELAVTLSCSTGACTGVWIVNTQLPM
jgi:hypothetical protein